MEVSGRGAGPGGRGGGGGGGKGLGGYGSECGCPMRSVGSSCEGNSVTDQVRGQTLLQHNQMEGDIGRRHERRFSYNKIAARTS